MSFADFMREQAGQATRPPVMPASPFRAFLESQDDDELRDAQALTVANAQAGSATAAASAPVARQLGIPQSAVETDLPRYQAQAKGTVNAEILARSPLVAKWVAANPDSARIAQDEYESLSLIEKNWEVTKSLGYGAVQGVGGGMSATGLMMNRALHPFVSVLGADEWWRRTMIDPLKTDQKMFTESDGLASRVGQAIGGLATMLSQITFTGGGGQAVPAAAGVLTTIASAVQNAIRSMAMPAATAAVNTSADVFNATGSAGNAITAGAVSGLNTVVMGVVPLSVPGGLVSRFFSGSVASAAQSESARAAMNLVLPQEMQRPFDLEQLVFDTVQGGVMGGVMGPRPDPNMMRAIRQTYDDAVRAEVALRDIGKIAVLGEIAAQSKLRQADPQAFRQFIETVTEQSNVDAVYVDPLVLGEALKQSKVDVSVMPEVVAQMDEAIATKADVRISVADYAAHIAGTDLEPVLLQSMRVSPDGMTMKEGQEFFAKLADEMKARAETVVKESEQSEALKADRDIVHKKVLDQLTAVNRFHADVNNAYAAMVRDFYTVMSARAGMKPSEMFEKMPLRVQAESPVGATLGQQVQTPAFKAWFGDSKVVDEKGEPLVVYHGTNKSEGGDAFTSFDTYASNYGLMGQGGYFTAAPAVASSYTRKGKGDSPTVYPVYLSINNPIDMDAEADAAAWQRRFPDSETWHEGGTTNESWYRAAEEALRDEGVPMYEGAEAMQEGLRAMGFDGITHMGGGRVAADGARHRVYVAFDPEQVKSAIGNRGTFDPNDPNILRQEAADAAGWKQAALQIAEAIARAQETDPFADFALRSLPTGDDSKVGDALPPSFRWEDGDPTEEELYGTSGVVVRDPQDATAVQRALLGAGLTGKPPHETPNGLYRGQRVALIKGESTGAGQDVDEIVVRDAVVVALWDRGTEQWRPIIPNEAAPPDDAGAGLPLFQPARGTYSPASRTITLLKDANLSTFLHESGHMFLDTLYSIAALDTAAPEVRKDLDILLKWFGVKDAQTWGAMTLDQQRPYHEQFARGFEAYLFEGKAPNLDLQPLFSRIRSWMVDVYKSLVGLNVKLTPEVRGVFDRMLASEAAIQEAEQARNYEPLFKSAEEAGMTPDQYRSYIKVGQDATEQSIGQMQAKSLADMKWLSRARGKALSQLQRQANAARKEVAAEAAAEVEQYPAFRALEDIRNRDPEFKARMDEWRARRDATKQDAAEAVKESRADAARTMKAWEDANPEPKRPKPGEKNVDVVEMRKRDSVLKALKECIG